MNYYYTSKCLRLENGKIVDEISGNPLSSNPDKAWIKVFLASDIELLLSQIEENNKKILELVEELNHEKICNYKM
jgi:hypothetical protein